MTGNLVTIVKDDSLVNIDEELLRQDDMVVLQAGDMVPADLKLVETRGLEVDEFEITGEILPVIQKADDQHRMIYRGSRVVRGTGKGIVVATGEHTEYGRVLKQGWEQNKPDGFRIFKAKYLILPGLILPALIYYYVHSGNGLEGIAIYGFISLFLILLQNDDLAKYLLISNELSGLRRFHIQFRDPRALERMSEIDLICFDKTGVLTTRQLNIKNIYFPDEFLGADHALGAIAESTAHWIRTACALCNDVFYFEKIDLADPIDRALISFAQQNGADIRALFRQYQRIYDKPFDSENRYMVSGFKIDGQTRYFAKGDPGVIHRMCSQYMTTHGAQKNKDFTFWHFLNSTIDGINQNGDTAIALAYATEDPEITPRAFTFLCLLQLENRLQPGVRETIRGIIEKGIRSLMVTGDREETALKISTESGITRNSRPCLDGRTMERMEFTEVARQSAYCSVFSRFIPSQKGILIRLLQQKGHCVAMVGDGPNDGIALKVADIGISFDKNSSPIARQLSKILIEQFADLLRLIESARRMKAREKYWKLFRVLTITGIFFCIYGWMFATQSL